MAGRGTDIKLAKGVAELGGSARGRHRAAPPATAWIASCLAAPPAKAIRVCARCSASADDELFLRHAPLARKMWRTIGADRVIRMAQNRAERLARFNRKQVLRSDDWMDQSLPF